MEKIFFLPKIIVSTYAESVRFIIKKDVWLGLNLFFIDMLDLI